MVLSPFIINRLDSQSKLQMFTLFSGRRIGLPRRYTNMAFSRSTHGFLDNALVYRSFLPQID